MVAAELVFATSRPLEVIFDRVDCWKKQCHPPLRITLTVTYVDFKNEIVFCRLVNDRPCFEELSQKLNNFYANPNFRKNIQQVKKNDLYAAAIDSVWYRVQLTWVHRADRSCGVCLIDVGRTVVLPLNSLFILDNWFINCPFDRRYSIQFTTPANGWSAFEEAGFLNCGELLEGNILDAFVLSETEPLVALFKRDEPDEVKQPKVMFGWQPSTVNHSQKNESFFTRSLTPSMLRDIELTRAANLSSSFSKSRLTNSSTMNNHLISFHNSVTHTVKPLTDGPFRVPSLRNRAAGRTIVATGDGVENGRSLEKDFLNRTLTSCESDTDNEMATKLLIPQKQGKNHIASVSPPSSHNTEIYSDLDSTLPQFDLQFETKVLNANTACEIYLETPETKKRMEQLKELLNNIKLESLKPVSSSWLIKGDVILYAPRSRCPKRVRVENNDNEELFLTCVDTGEEIYSENNELCYFRLPPELTMDRFGAACLGPLRLAEKYSPNWLTVESGVRLRELCRTVVSARFDIASQGRWVTLIDVEGRNVNQIFDAYTKMSPAMRLKENVRRALESEAKAAPSPIYI